MNLPNEQDFTYNRTWAAARDLGLAFSHFMEKAALDRYHAVQLVLHELAAEALDEIGQRQVSRDIRYRTRGLREGLNEALANKATRKRRWGKRQEPAAPEPTASVPSGHSSDMG